jgi:hypothetical protein
MYQWPLSFAWINNWQFISSFTFPSRVFQDAFVHRSLLGFSFFCALFSHSQLPTTISEIRTYVIDTISSYVSPPIPAPANVSLQPEKTNNERNEKQRLFRFCSRLKSIENDHII